ncbi:MAG: hypothetical protein MZV70_06760 [Desulfobacterales bacterium]|nr:hypothetical protein [Desulfobacterales bacterium]
MSPKVATITSGRAARCAMHGVDLRPGRSRTPGSRGRDSSAIAVGQERIGSRCGRWTCVWVAADLHEAPRAGGWCGGSSSAIGRDSSRRRGTLRHVLDRRHRTRSPGGEISKQRATRNRESEPKLSEPPQTRFRCGTVSEFGTLRLAASPYQAFVHGARLRAIYRDSRILARDRRLTAA